MFAELDIPRDDNDDDDEDRTNYNMPSSPGHLHEVVVALDPQPKTQIASSSWMNGPSILGAAGALTSAISGDVEENTSGSAVPPLVSIKAAEVDEETSSDDGELARASVSSLLLKLTEKVLPLE